MWTRDGNLAGAKDWYQSIDYVNNLNLGGYSDWRLPNINELESLLNTEQQSPSTWLNDQGFKNVQYDWYWSSTTRAASADSAWAMSMMVGWIVPVSQKGPGGGIYLLPVRAGQFGSPDITYPANIWKTGQAISYYPGDDGDIQAGVSWPSNRFTDNSDGMIIDSLTGLMWTKDAKSFSIETCTVGNRTWQDALDYVKCLNINKYLGYNDWRLPNRKELYSLYDYSQYHPALPAGHPFINLESSGNDDHWSSTTVGAYPYGHAVAWLFRLTSEGGVGGSWKSNSFYYNYSIWPVRGPQEPATIYVPDDYTTIQGAVDAANPGDMVIVRAGTYVLGNLTVSEEVTLKLEPGVVMKFVTCARLLVKGYLVANGTSDAHIVFTSINDDFYGGDTNGDGNATVPTKNDWGNICFIGSGGGSILDHVIVEYGGRGWSFPLYELLPAVGVYTSNLIISNSIICESGNEGISIWSASPRITDNIITNNNTGIYLYNASPTITGNTIKGNSYCGIQAREFSNPIIQNNTIEENQDWAFRLDTSSSGANISQNTVSGPGAGIFVDGGNLSTSLTWRSDTPYVVGRFVGYYLPFGVTILEGCALTIEPGVVVKFQVSACLYVNGSLNADGTPEKQIIFTSLQDDSYGGDTNGDGTSSSAAPGDWGFLQFRDTSNSNNLNHVVVKYGGRTYDSPLYVYRPAIDIFPSNVKVSNSLITENANAGIGIWWNSSPKIIYNTISNNNYNGIEILDASPTITGNTINGNQWYGIYTRSSSGSTIYFNNFANNSNNVRSEDSTNIWNSPQLISYTYNGMKYTNYLGNYWDDYTGTDADGDGIGDTLYSIDRDSDNYPLTMPFENYEIGGEAPQGYAIIVAGQGGRREKWGIDHSANNAYRVLRNLGLHDEDILYLNSNSLQDIDGDGNAEVDGPASFTHFKNAINEAKKKIQNKSIPLILYLTGHGEQNLFVFDPDDLSPEGEISASNLREMLNGFSSNTPMLIVIGSCSSGSFITSDQSISGSNRIIITAAHDETDFWSTRVYLGWVRSADRFLGNLNKGLNVKEAFVQKSLPGDCLYLWLDDNGDSIGHPPHNLDNDGQLASVTQIGVPGTENLELIRWYLVWKRSPGELRVYDSQNQVTGLVNGEIREEIPGSLYDEENEIVAIFAPCDVYHYEVLSTSEGTYGLDIGSIKGGETETFTAIDIPTSPNAVHQYTADWEALSQGGAGVTLLIDAEGDGIFERTIISDNKLTPCEIAVEPIGYELISQKKITETEFEYIFRLVGKNTGKRDVKNITLNLAREPNGTSVIDGVVYFSTIQAGEQLLSDDTFTVRSDKSPDILVRELIWQVCKCVERPKSDFSHDWTVSLADLAKFTDQWLNSCSEPNWCQGTDLDQSNLVNFMDFATFAQNWLWEIIPADFNIDGEVEFTDYAVLANRWRAGNCAESAWCDGADLNKSGSVDLLDLAEFAELWLEGR
jgi:parallel beta-helix repeat protein